MCLFWLKEWLQQEFALGLNIDQYIVNEHQISSQCSEVVQHGEHPRWGEMPSQNIRKCPNFDGYEPVMINEQKGKV